jgi:hypothetical protein
MNSLVGRWSENDSFLLQSQCAFRWIEGSAENLTGGSNQNRSKVLSKEKSDVLQQN